MSILRTIAVVVGYAVATFLGLLITGCKIEEAWRRWSPSAPGIVTAIRRARRSPGGRAVILSRAKT